MASVLTNPEETNIFAIIYPAPGKMERLKELMAIHIVTTHENEDYTLRYFMTEAIDPSAEQSLYCFETYKSKALAEQHTQTENFRALTEAAQKEELLAKPPVIVFTKTVGGYDWDRKLLVR